MEPLQNILYESKYDLEEIIGYVIGTKLICNQISDESPKEGVFTYDLIDYNSSVDTQKLWELFEKYLIKAYKYGQMTSDVLNEKARITDQEKSYQKAVEDAMEICDNILGDSGHELTILYIKNEIEKKLKRE